MAYDYDLFVLGGGSGGVRCSRVAAKHGARVAVAEERHLGGTCVNVGCIPKKLFCYASHFHEDFEDARNFGWSIDGARFDWTALIASKDKEIDRLNGIYKKLLAESGVSLTEARAVLVDPHTVEMAGKRVLIADDVRNTGKTFERCAELVQQAGGIVLATVEICDRMEAVVEVGVPNYALAEYKAPENFAAADCPMCKAGEPITSF